MSVLDSVQRVRRDEIEKRREYLGVPKGVLAVLSNNMPQDYADLLAGRPVSAKQLAAFESTLEDIAAVIGWANDLVGSGVIAEGLKFPVVLPLDLSDVDKLRRLIGQMRVSQTVL